MRLTQANRAQNHARIVDAAARLFRARGVDGVGIDEIMAEAGLTHGAFYGHFPSKSALVAEASTLALDRSGLKLLEADITAGARKSVPELIARYLSPGHRDDPANGCAVAALGADAGRQDPMVRASFAEGLERRISELAGRLPGDSEAARREAIVLLTAMVGTLVMARGAGNSALTDELLGTMRQRLAAETPQDVDPK